MPETCNSCGNRLIPHMSEVRDPLTGETFDVAKCIKCGLGHTLPQPGDMGHYYAEPYYGNRHGFTLRHCMRRRLRFIAAALPERPGRRLLDIGCGDGSFLMAARDAGWDVMGTELNPQPARAAGLDVREGIEQITSSDQFDCVTMWHTLEHMRDIPSMLANIARMIRPEGRLIIAVPDSSGLQALIFRERWLHADVPRHLYHFDDGSLQHCLNAAGFSIERRWHQEFEYDLLGWSQSALNRLMPRHPNLFMDTVTGKGGEGGNLIRGGAFLIGSLLTLLSLPLLLLGTLMGRGGSLVVVAKHGEGTGHFR